MGARGIVYALAPLRADPSTDDDAIRAAVWRCLRDEWHECDHGESGAAAVAAGWTDDTLTLDVERRDDGAALVFWFNESVEWPSALAEHWLEIALASGRTGLDGALATFGFALAASRTLPTLETHLFHPKGPPRVVHGGAIWRFDPGTSRLFAEASLTRGVAMHDEIALAELPEQTRARVESLAASHRCGCPICRGIFDTELGAESLAAAAGGWRTERVERWPYTLGVRLHALRDGYLVTLATSTPIVYFQRGGGEFQRVGLPRSFDAPGLFRCVSFATGVNAAFAIGPSGCATTADGVVWSEVPGSAFDGCAARPLGAQGEDLALWQNRDRKLLLSRDAGATFSERTFPSDAQEIALLTWALASPEIAYAVIVRADGETELLRSDDALRTWARRASFGKSEPKALLVGRDADAVTYLHDEHAVRSSDAGASFTPVWPTTDHFDAALIDASGQLFVSRGFGSLELSTDDGATWSTIANDGVTSLAPVLGSRDVMATTFHVQFRLLAPGG